MAKPIAYDGETRMMIALLGGHSRAQEPMSPCFIVRSHGVLCVVHCDAVDGDGRRLFG